MKNLINALENKKISSKEEIAKALTIAQETIKKKDEIIEKQRKKLEEQKPFVMFAIKVANNSDCISLSTFSKLIKYEDVKLERNKLFDWLRDNKYLMKDNTPYQQYIDREYFVIKEYTITTPYGEKLKTKTLLTGKGLIYFTEKLREIFK